MNKAVFFDRDGTINIDYGYVYQYYRFDFIDGVKETMKELKNMGYLLIIITNQSGVARGYYTEKDVIELHEKVCSDLKREGIDIDGIYYCPHLSGCTCRKPLTGMFYQAAEEHDIDFSNSVAVGDKIRDLSICGEEPVRGFLVNREDGYTEEEPKYEIYNKIIKVNNIRDILKYLRA